MHAIVLAGGYATRLWPLTKHRPKMFLPIGHETVIARIFDRLEADDRIDDVYVSTNARFGDGFEDFLDRAAWTKPTLSIEETTAEEEKLGVVGSLTQLVEREGLTKDTLVVAGDNLIGFELSDFIDHFQRDSSPTLAAYDVGSYEKASSYGLVELNDANEVVDFQEKPDNPTSTLVSIACYGFPARTLSLLDSYLANGNNPDEPGWFLQWLQQRVTVRAFTFDEAWFDIGTPESYLDAVTWHLDGGSLIDPSATVERSEIGENVHVMAGATVLDSHVERSIVFPDATIRNCELRGSIIDQNTTVEDTYLSGALIGAHTTLNGQKRIRSENRST